MPGRKRGLTYTSPSQPALKKPISSCCTASEDTGPRCPYNAVMNCPGSWRTVNKLTCPFCAKICSIQARKVENENYLRARKRP